ncbi:hypothetical protein AB0L10_37535 [Streptomyces flaveolus]
MQITVAPQSVDEDLFDLDATEEAVADTAAAPERGARSWGSRTW